MGRKKLAMELIGKKASRLLSFAKRKKSLLKSAHELSTLCGVEICMIIRNDECNDSEVWPAGPDTISRMVKWTSSGKRNKSGLCDFYKEQREREGVEKKIDKGDFDGLSIEELRELGSSLNSKIDDVREKIRLLKAAESNQERQICDSSMEESMAFEFDDIFFNVEDLLKGEDQSVQESGSDWGNSSMQESMTFDDIADLLKGEDQAVQETGSDEDFFLISDDWLERCCGMQPAMVDLLEGRSDMPIL